MGKEGQLWDDSALINAFDEAISKYKKMHGKGYKERSSDGAGDVKSCTGDASAAIAASLEDNSHPETVDDGKNDGSHAIVEVAEVDNLQTTNENEVADQQLPEEHALGSSSLPSQEQSQSHSSTLDHGEYSTLYKQYYEVEEQRQKILQKLQYFSSWNYQLPEWGANSATQEYQTSINQVPSGTMVVSCCPCAWQCSLASCSSLTCPLAGACAGHLCTDPSAVKGVRKQPTFEHVDIVKTAMGAAERAISTLKDKTSDWKEDNEISKGMEQGASSETDLSVVLSAWYSAGFYTGKYLTEQSLAKK